ncbi:MAG: recombination mediator RecR [Patescibacteria group bacterium]|nr:recombination mediator RecR [Patescibacteria group bacterium]MDD5294998.1 recombination mediator RecR [Patescibacteria group bacterium]MDD5554962.1 recombination mediator RecR [Patescibacteria group bacterium]
MKFPLAIQNLIDQFSRLPSVGPKTAQRYVFYLLRQPAEELQKLAQFIAELKEKTITCSRCLSLAESNPCPICADKKRQADIICIVANTQDMLTLEATRQYNGLYHVLGGLINTIEEVKPEQLNIKQLINRIEKDGIKEIILALNPTVEGETTAMYLVKLLKPYKIKITKLARGLPSGADLEYADEITLANALKYRNEL